ncbi:hypothetical protein [Tepidibacter sp. Z1-5]|uniref:hypothetical protein n=1 Tax=Tepidibacter sp. Z1-5 TaxID=3134138 RepID=UPI0030BBFCAA
MSDKLKSNHLSNNKQNKGIEISEKRSINNYSFPSNSPRVDAIIKTTLTSGTSSSGSSGNKDKK